MFGVGLGSYAGDFSVFGDHADPRVRGRKTDEGLDVLDGLWSGERFDYAGEYFTIFRDVPGDANVPRELLAEAVAFVRGKRAADAGPFDVVLEGATPGAPPLAEYVDAGLTWWVEKLGWWRGDLEATRRRIRQGPPTL